MYRGKGDVHGVRHCGRPDRRCPEPPREVKQVAGAQIADQANLAAAKLTNPKAKFVGASINTKGLDEAAAKDYLAKVEREIGLPTVDPIRTGVGRIADTLS